MATAPVDQQLTKDWAGYATGGTVTFLAQDDDKVFWTVSSTPPGALLEGMRHARAEGMISLALATGETLYLRGRGKVHLIATPAG